MTQTRWYHGGASQRRNGKPCTPPPACKDWERRHWQAGWNDKDEALSGVHCTAHVDYDVDSRVSGA